MTGREIKEDLRQKTWDLEDDTEYYSTSEFAEKYGYTDATVRQMIKRCQISRVKKLYGRWLIPENATIKVQQYVKKKK